MLFQFDVQTLTIGIGIPLEGMMLPLTDGHRAAARSALLQMMMQRMGVATRRRTRRMMMMMVMIGGQWIFVTLFLHGEVIIVAARLQRIDAMRFSLKVASATHYIIIQKR